MGRWSSFGKKFSSLGGKFRRKPKQEEPEKERLPPPYWEEGGRHFEGGPIIKVILIILLIVGIGFVGWWLWNTSGAGQASSGTIFNIQYGFGKFMESSGIRAFWWQITHPFEIQPQQAKEENVNPKYQLEKSLRESIEVGVDVAPEQMEYGQGVGFINVKITNKGTQDIKKFYLLVLPIPDNNVIHCLGPGINNSKIDPAGISAEVCGNKLWDKDLCGGYKSTYSQGHNYLAIEYNKVIISGGTSIISLSGVYVNNSKECVEGKKAWVPTAYPFYVRVITPYIAASRLPITFLNSNYASLLYRQGNLKQGKVPATAMAGTAVKINIDAGLQPIIRENNSKAPLPILFNFENLGSGKLIGSPRMVLIIPKNLGRCSESYFVCSGDSKFKGLINNFNETYYPLFSSFAKKEIEWITEQSGESGEYNFCITNVTHEFQTYSCTLTPNVNFNGQKRITEFLTAFAVYNYEAETSGQVKAYTTQSEGS